MCSDFERRVWLYDLQKLKLSMVRIVINANSGECVYQNMQCNKITPNPLIPCFAVNSTHFLIKGFLIRTHISLH